MKKIFDYWFPDSDDHFARIMKEDRHHQYQREKRDTAVSYVKNFNLAIDIGGHVGLWSRPLSDKFKKVITFEPIFENRECLIKNLEGRDVDIHPYALGDKSGVIKLALPSSENTGGYTMSSDGMSVEIKTLDEFSFNDIGFIKIDVQCMEIPVLIGSIDTLIRCNPVLCIEQGETEKPAINFVKQIGYNLVKVVGKEHIFIKNTVL